MNKRQKKKKQKKYLPIIADEFNLITMTDAEREKAFEEYNKFREHYAYRKKYKDLNKGKMLHYYFPPGQQAMNFIQTVSNRVRKQSKMVTVTQNINDFS